MKWWEEFDIEKELIIKNILCKAKIDALENERGLTTLMNLKKVVYLSNQWISIFLI